MRFRCLSVSGYAAGDRMHRHPQDTYHQAKNRPASPNTHVTLPTWLPLLRLAGRPSTPKGVGPAGPLTACLRGANHAARSAGSDSAFKVSTCGLGYGRGCGHGYGLSVRSHLAFCCGVCRSQVSDHTQSRCKRGIYRNCVWSDTWDISPVGCPDDCGRLAVSDSVVGEYTVVGDMGKTKWERNGGRLRLGRGWWSA